MKPQNGNDEVSGLEGPKSVQPQIPHIGASVLLSGPLAKRRNAALAALPYLAVRMARHLGTSAHATLNELEYCNHIGLAD
eukprot:6184413-Pleurochrysis_carterae.AAC.8